jgi:hypothetical protein
MAEEEVSVHHRDIMDILTIPLSVPVECISETRMEEGWEWVMEEEDSGWACLEVVVHPETEGMAQSPLFGSSKSQRRM